MMRKIFKRKKEEFAKVKESVEKKHEEAKEALPPIAKDTGGSISNLPIKTKAFKNWLSQVRENINPLIGKSYLTSAPEYSTGDKMVGELEVTELSELGKLTEEKFEEDLPESPKGNEDHEEKFIDINIIENAVREAFGEDDETMKSNAEEKMKKYHDNPEYESDIDIMKTIFKYKRNLIAKKEAEKLLEKGSKEGDEDDNLAPSDGKK